MSDYRTTADWLKAELPREAEVAIILGTGLSDMASSFKIIRRIPYSEIPGFVAVTAPSHQGNFILAEIADKVVIFLQGRFHCYEGYAIRDVVFPIRVLACLGVKTIVLTNASGSLRKDLTPGTIVQLTDHINFMGANPLTGQNDESLGERFPSLNDPYDPGYIQTCADIAGTHGINLRQGVYVAVSGPSLETRAECAAFAKWGADLVGMSTVPEVIAARHAGLKVAAFSVVTNYSNLFHDLAHSQEEIQMHAARASEKLQTILGEFIAGLIHEA